MRTKRVLLQGGILEKILDSFMMFYLKQKKQDIPGMILSVDFEKAFDTVSWKFIEKVLNYRKCSKISNTLKLRTPKIIDEINF